MLNFLSFLVLLYVSGHFQQKKNFKIFQTDRKILTCHLVCCNFSKSQGGKIQILLELSYHSHLKKEGMTAAIVDHRRRGGLSKPYFICFHMISYTFICFNTLLYTFIHLLYAFICFNS